jgi:hypothetical protein
LRLRLGLMIVIEFGSRSSEILGLVIMAKARVKVVKSRVIIRVKVRVRVRVG